MNTNTKIAKKLDALLKLKRDLQNICDELDEKYDLKGDPKILLKLNRMQGCLNYLKQAEKELTYI